MQYNHILADDAAEEVKKIQKTIATITNRRRRGMAQVPFFFGKYKVINILDSQL